MADQLPDHGEAVLKKLIQEWWRGDIVKHLAKGEPAIPREQLYAFYEMLHCIRDNLRIDLRESAPSAYFQALPDGPHRRPLPGSITTLPRTPTGCRFTPVMANRT